MYKASSIFTNINELPFNNEEERTKLRVFFAYNDATKVEAILSTITKDEAKVEFLRGYVDKSRDEHQGVLQKDLEKAIRSAVREELSQKNPEVISASGLSDNKMNKIMNKIGMKTIVLCADDFKSFEPVSCSPFEWNENEDESAQMKEVVKWFKNVLKLPRDCQVKDIHTQIKNQTHLESANTIITGGSDISIGPSATSVIWIETKIDFNDFKKGQAMGELFLIDKLHPTHSMTVLTDCKDNWILFFFLKIDNEQTIAVCEINNRGVALTIIKQFVLEETNRLNGWIGKLVTHTTISAPPLLKKTKFLERIEINEDRMSEIIDDLSEQELFNMDIRNKLRVLKDYVKLDEQRQLDHLISHFNDDYEVPPMFV
ncbi:16876_t:CDS:2 [Funneliformis caledonium]|uniref:16876_t:CDS:1 n=1 Tax=Funneliformis caledonium TaxID=1117310 RepID=A0A9N9FRQ4_9GLOM|nr:16876_t:CDS:2 [Funneliformis caledonium]